MHLVKGFWGKTVSSPEKKVLVENFFSLSFLESSKYILPLIVLPYLVRVLGAEKYGLIAFAQAFIQYFVVLTNYGFDLSATRQISINRGDKSKISEIFSSVVVLKLGLMILSFLVLTGLVFTVPKFKKDLVIYMLTFGVVIGQCLFPVWFFQGMEKMKYITFLNITAKLIFTISIFIFVKTTQDYVYVPLINSLGFLAAGILGLWISYKKFGINFIFPNIKSIKEQMREGWYIFISKVSINLYTSSSIFVLGLFANNTVVGYYAAAEKLIRAVQRLLSPISNTVYPYINKLASYSKERALSFIRKLVILVSGVSFIVSLAIFVFANFIVNIVLGPQYQESIIVLRILAFVPFLASMVTIFGTQTMLPFNLKEAFSKIFISAGIIHISLALILIPFYKHIGVSIAVLITESFIASAMFFYLKHKHLLSLKYILTKEF